MSAKVEVVTSTPLSLGEAPHWDEKRQLLFHVDAFSGDIHRFDPNTRTEDKVHVGKFCNFVIPRSDNDDEFVFASERSVQIVNWISGEVRPVATLDQDKPADPPTIINDGKCDAAGRLWTGTLHFCLDWDKVEPDLGSVYSIDGNHKVVKRWPRITTSNGLAWSNDNKYLYYVDTFPTGTIYAFDYDSHTGDIENQRVVLDFKNLGKEYGHPDGMTIDKEGKLWIACFGGGQIIRVDPEAGKVLQSVKFPVTQVSSCCFGGPNFTDLYVTSIRDMLKEEEKSQQPLAGRVFKVTGLNAAGSISNTFAG